MKFTRETQIMENQTESFRHEHGFFLKKKKNSTKNENDSRKKCQRIDFIQGPHFILLYYSYSFAISRDKQIHNNKIIVHCALCNPESFLRDHFSVYLNCDFVMESHSRQYMNLYTSKKHQHIKYENGGPGISCIVQL